MGGKKNKLVAKNKVQFQPNPEQLSQAINDFPGFASQEHMESLKELVNMYENTCPVHSKLGFYSVNCKTCNIPPHEREHARGPWP